MCNISPIHIGTGRENYYMAASELHSDTISSALAATGAITGKCNDIKEFISSFVISSAFPFYGKYYFLPKIQGRLNISVRDAEEYEYRKKLKKIRYIETSLWSELASGKKLDINSSQIQGQFLVPDNVALGVIERSQITQRVKVSRTADKDSEPFFFDWHYFSKEAGLYCITDAKGECLNTILDLFTVLGETGFGTDKSVGGGKFDVETDALFYSEPHDANKSVLMSLYIPTEDELKEILNNNCSYSLILRGGYMAGSDNPEFRHLRKKMIYAFGTGSVFETSKNLVGRVVDLQPAWNDDKMHPVYRSGKALAFRIKQ